MYALFIKHRAKPGMREDLEAAWRRNMLPAVEANDSHLAYVYGFGVDPDTVGAFQLYSTEDDANTFVTTPAYLAYLEEAREYLTQEPEVTIIDPRWVKRP